VVEKPGSMPVHPTGRYGFNTLLEILKYDYGLPLVHSTSSFSRSPRYFPFLLTLSPPLLCCLPLALAASNRLDRLTSGVMICSLTVEGSKKLGAWFGGRRAAEGGVKKEYVARVVGKFPECVVSRSSPSFSLASAER
jgi:23S rRNA-/tRNA-specific pseudouridylate synthase